MPRRAARALQRADRHPRRRSPACILARRARARGDARAAAAGAIANEPVPRRRRRRRYLIAVDQSYPLRKAKEAHADRETHGDVGSAVARSVTTLRRRGCDLASRPSTPGRNACVTRARRSADRRHAATLQSPRLGREWRMHHGALERCRSDRDADLRSRQGSGTSSGTRDLPVPAARTARAARESRRDPPRSKSPSSRPDSRSKARSKAAATSASPVASTVTCTSRAT